MNPVYIFTVLLMIVGYLLGSINSSIIVSKAMGKDIREVGSGNAGLTNTLRSLGKGAALCVLLGDVLKSAVPVLAAKLLGFDLTTQLLVAFATILGHNYPIYFGFRGGKGILTTATVVCVISPLSLLILLVAFILIVLIFRYVSLSSIICVLCFPVAFYFLVSKDPVQLILTIAIALLAVWRHHGNIKRLLNGTENKLF